MSESADSTEASEEKGADVRFPPPFVPLILLAVGIAIDKTLAPIGWVPEGLWRWGLGGVLVADGVLLLGLANGLFRKTGQDPKPWKPAPELIIDGIYNYTRNPMYLGMGSLQAGLGFLFASVTPAILVPITWWIIYRIAIRHEEAYLVERFGEPYEAYMRQTRRWL